MKSIKKFLLLQIFLILFTDFSFACGPCAALTNVTQTINGTNLELTFTSNAGWACCFTIEIEIVCANANFTGIATNLSPELCLSNPVTDVPYPLTVIDISNLCPGNYQWRARECGEYTPVFTFTVAGVNPIVVNASLSEDSICLNDNAQLTASASIGCNGGPFSYSWSPATGLNDPNIANPVATPSSTTTYQVTVTENGSCVAPQTASLTVTVNPLPTATISEAIAVCQNANSPILTMTGANGTGPYTINYTLNGNAQTAIIANNTATLQVPTATSGVYIYILTSVQDASSTQCINAQTGYAIVTVNALPVINGGIDQAVCAGTAVTLNGSNATASIWNNGVTNGVAFTPLATNTYTVTVTDIYGCINTDQVIVTVNPIPTVGAGIDQTICIGGPVTLFGSGAATYSWNNGVTNGTPFSPITTTTYTVTGTSTPGCIATDQVVVNVNPLPIVNAGLDQTVCIGTSVTLTGSGASTYGWTSPVINNTAFTPGVGMVTYTVTGTSSAGCINTDQVIVTVNSLPLVTPGTYSAVCVDAADVVLIGTPAGGTFSGTGVSANSFNPSVGTQIITYSYTDGNSCMNSATTSIVVNPLPNINAGVDQSVCLGSNVTLSGSGGLTYSWNSATNGQAFVPSLGNTIYTVTGTDTYGCVNTDTVNVTVLSVPISNISSDVNIGTAPLVVNFTNSSNNATSYIWNFGNGSIVIANNLSPQVSSYNDIGTYQVVLLASNGICSDTATLIIIIPFTDPIIHVPNVFTPNNDGSNDFFFIDHQYISSIHIIVFNRWGNLVYETEDLLGKWDGDEMAEGVYFFKYSITNLNDELIEGHGNITLIR